MVFHKKKENGDVIDMVSFYLVLLFTIALLFLFTCFAKEIQMRMMCDTLAKRYLYRMETAGCMTEEIKADIINDFCNEFDISAADISLKNSTTVRVPYGETILLCIDVTLPSPLATTFQSPFGDFLLKDNQSNTDLYQKLQYKKVWEGTAKW